MKISVAKKILGLAALASVVVPMAGFAATASIKATRSDTYLMGIIPYYVYGYDLKFNAATVAKALTPPPVAPKLPIAGGGGKSLVPHSR